MVSLLTSSVVDHWFQPWSGQTEDYKIGICCFCDKHATLRSKSKDCVAQNQDNVSKGCHMSTCGLLFQWSCTIKIQLSVFESSAKLIFIVSLKCNLFSPWYRWKIVHLDLNNNHSHTLTKNNIYHVKKILGFFSFCQLNLCSDHII